MKIGREEIVVRQGSLCLTVSRADRRGHPLRAPVEGAMTRTIHEHPSCEVRYRLEHRGVVLLNFEAPNAPFAYEF